MLAATVTAPLAWAVQPALALGWGFIGFGGAAELVRAGRLRRRRQATPDPSTALEVDAALGGLDRVEFRSVELGTPWPQLTVGPTGVTIIDVCPTLSRPSGRPVPRSVEGRLTRLAAARRVVRETLEEAGVDLPVRAVVVFAAGQAAPRLRRRAHAPDLWVAPEELPGALVSGPVASMPVVDAAFRSLARRPELATAT